ncbi:1067_t:CDS:1, partial [Acaulospora colombiana]
IIVQTQPKSSDRYVIQCYGVSQNPETKDYIFIMPYMQHGSLREYLSKNFNSISWIDWGESGISK